MIKICPIILHIALVLVFLYGCIKDPAGPDDPPLDKTVTEYTYQIITSYPHDVNAFTQGLVYHDGFFMKAGVLPMMVPN